MAGEMNVSLAANLTADPELAEVGGRQVCRLRLAHNTRTKRGGEWVNDETWWIDGTVWPRFEGDSWPSNVAASLSKGDAVDVSGRLKREPWQGRDGREGISYRLAVETVGVALQRAQVQVMRNEHAAVQASQGSGWGAPAQPQQEWGQAAAPAASAQAQASFDGFDDEKPF